MSKSFWIGIIVVLIISLGSVSYQKFVQNPFCSFDGSPVMDIYEVDIVLKDNSTKKFCSIYCASRWFNNNHLLVDHVIVTDEIRGNKIEAFMAYYVESDLVTNKSNGNRIHAFQQRRHAQIHAAKFNGETADDPFYIDDE